MPVFTRENVTPSYIENTTMQKVYMDGIHRTYEITPVSGYVLHDRASDWDDPMTGYERGYTVGTCSCAANYDFTPRAVTVTDRNGVSMEVTGYGDREFFAIPENTAPENNIFGGGDNEPEHEVM